MELRQLRYFLSVARRGSVGKAAEEHYITQPAVSIQIRRLEEELGTSLFVRIGRRLVLTDAGRLLLAHAERIVDGMTSLEESFASFRGLRKGELKLGAIDAAGVYVLPPVLERFLRRYPGIETNVEVADSHRLIKDVLDGRVELAVVTLPVARDGLEVFPVYEDKMVLVVHPSHRIARVRRGLLEAVAEGGLITYPAESTTRRMIEEVFREKGLALRTTMEVSSPEAMKKLVEMGMGPSVLPERLVQGEVKMGVLKALGSGRVSFRRILGVVFREKRALSPQAREFFEMLLERYKAPRLGAIGSLKMDVSRRRRGKGKSHSGGRR